MGDARGLIYRQSASAVTLVSLIDSRGGEDRASFPPGNKVCYSQRMRLLALALALALVPACTPAAVTPTKAAAAVALPRTPRSAGCGKAPRPAGAQTTTIDGLPASYLVAVPPSYVSDTAVPLVFAFHGRNRTHENCRETDCIGIRAEIEPRALVVYMKSLGGTGWEGPSEREHNVRFFEAVLSDIEASYCVDTTQVIATGTSSGAFFTNVLGCRYGDVLRGVVPVSGGMPEKEGCKGEPISIVVHGVDDDKVRLPLGVEARDTYLARNHCGAATSRPIPALHASVSAERESHACVEYQGCDAGTRVGWCEHSEGGYDGSTHGWPKFAGSIVGGLLDVTSGARPALFP